MLKKFAVISAIALVIGGFALINSNTSLKDACTRVCCNHDGDMLSN